MAGSIPARVAALLATDPGRVFKIAEIAAALSLDARAISGSVARMARTSKIKKVGHGKFRAMDLEVAQ